MQLRISMDIFESTEYVKEDFLAGFPLATQATHLVEAFKIRLKNRAKMIIGGHNTHFSIRRLGMSS